MASSLYEQISKTATEFVRSYEQDKCGVDIKALSSTLTPECRRVLLPASMTQALPSLAAGLTNEQYETHLRREIENVFVKWDVDLLDLTVDETAKKAVARSMTSMSSASGHEYSFEFVFTLFMTADGTKVQKVDQFVDTALAQKFMSEQAAALHGPHGS